MSTEQPSEPYCVVIGFDYSETSVLAIAEAIGVASRRGRVHLHFIQATAAPASSNLVTGVSVAGDQGRVDQHLQRASEELRDYVTRLLGAPGEQQLGDPSLQGVAWTTHVQISDPVHAITQLATDVQANLIIVGTHGRKGLARFLLGSVAEGVVRHAPCPVLVVRPLGSEAADNVPKIQPACPQCVAARRASGGSELWCEQHKRHHGRRHTYHFSPFRSSRQSGLL